MQASKKLLFARHVFAQLRQIGVFKRSGWGGGEFTIVFLAEQNQDGKGVPVFVGWTMNQQDNISQVWSAVGSGGLLAESGAREPSRDEIERLRHVLIQIVLKSQENANSNARFRFDVAFRLDGDQPLYLSRPFDLPDSCVVTLPREADCEKKRWGYNPGIGVLLTSDGADEEDARIAASPALNDFVLFWSVLSCSFVRNTSHLFGVPTNWSASRRRLIKMRLPDREAKQFQVYSKIDSKREIRGIRPLWREFSERRGLDRQKLLGAMAAFRAGVQLSNRTYFPPSLPVVAFFASLEALSHQPRSCSGTLECDICGQLSFRHNLEGRVTLLLQLLERSLRKADFRRVKPHIKKSYESYRSSYVHSARTPFREHQPWAGVFNLHDPVGFWKGQHESFIVGPLENATGAAILHDIFPRSSRRKVWVPVEG